MPRKKPLRILCFGASLVAGFPYGHPFAGKLKEKLEEAFPNLDVQCEVEGVPGALVTADYERRMAQAWKLVDDKYDWTIVLGGTNDLGHGRQADAIFEGLKKAWNIPLAKRSKVLALTIPDAKYNVGPGPERRRQVNASIKNYQLPNFYTCDLFEAVPYHAMSAHDQSRYWEDDGLHLKPAGYDLMGEKIASSLITILKIDEAKQDSLESPSVNSGRKGPDELYFEEEIGNPRLLSQGYIVVRKKDLD